MSAADEPFVENWTTGDKWEQIAGFSRATRIGDLIAVSGTTANGLDGDGEQLGDTYAQTLNALDRALAVVGALGGSVATVLRTRVMLAPGADWEAASRAHAERLGERGPANSMYYVHALIGDGYLVEIEMDAMREVRS